MNELLQKQIMANHVTLLNEGDERGLDFFYRRLQRYFMYRAEKATKDDCVAESIVQEAFLRLWLFRERVATFEEIMDFLKNQIRSAVQAFYRKSRNRFHSNLLRLDSMEDYQKFMLGYELEEEAEAEDLDYTEQLEEEKQERLKLLHSLLPQLREDQQLFIRLCLKYSFNYERIAYYLGGISDYAVGLQVEKTIDALRAIVSSKEKMEKLSRPSRMVVQGDFDEEQAEIFHMRYTLQMSFDEISEALKLSAPAVKKLFVEAHAKVKKSQKQTA